MAGLYLVGAWLLVQVAGSVLPMFGAPAWVPRTIVLLLVIAFVPALVFAWVFELTPDGIKRDADVTPGESIAAQTARRMEHMIVGVLLLAVGYFCVDKFVLAPRREAAALASERNVRVGAAAAAVAANAKSIAVLPFENLSEDKSNGYFADGIQDQILTGLARIGDLKVISRTSTQKYASRPDNLSKIARELGVAHILEGSVQRAGNKVRINVQLIDAATDNHLWAEIYDRTLDDVFQVESEVAEKIAGSLAATLTTGERAALAQKPTAIPAAYDAYLQARAMNARTVNTREEADVLMAAYRRAVALDPNFALAWAELARTAFRNGWAGLDPSPALRAEGERALARAIALAPQAPQVDVARGVELYYVKRDFAGAHALMQSVKQRLPNDSDAWMLSGLLARRLGLWDASVADLEHARTLAPNDADLAYHLAVTRTSMGDCPRAVRAIDASLALAPDNSNAFSMKVQCAWFVGDLPGARRIIAAADQSVPTNQGLLGTQLLYERDDAGAAAAYRRAIAADHTTQLDMTFDGYVPVSLDWRLQLALAERALGHADVARALDTAVESEATRALATRPDNLYVAAAWSLVRGLARAGLGQRDAAAADADHALALVPESADALEGPGWGYFAMRIHGLNGDAARVVPLARHLVATNASFVSTAILRVDPAFDAVRSDPGFAAVAAGKGR